MSKSEVIILYLRLSVEDLDTLNGEKDESNSISNQRDLLHDYLKSHKEFEGCTVVELCDDGYSGTNTERPSFQKLLQMAKEHQVNCVIVKDFSRFGRDYLMVCDYVDQVFPFLGIRFISVNDGYDSQSNDGATSDIDIVFRNLVNAYYSKDISEKVRSGKRTRAENGKYLSAFAPIGYCKDKKDKNHLVIDEGAAEIVRRIFHLAGMGMSVLKITRLLNAEKVPTPSAIKKTQGLHHKWWDGPYSDVCWHTGVVTLILRDERYLGKTVYGKKARFEVGNRHAKKCRRDEWIIVEECHEPLVSLKEFGMAQSMLKEYAEGNMGGQEEQLFTGKLWCGVCGYALCRRKNSTPQYYCATKYRTDAFDCMKGHIKEAVLADVVFQAVMLYCKTLLEEQMRIKKVSKALSRPALEKQLVEYTSAITGFDEQKAVLYDKKLEGVLSKEQYTHRRETLTIQQEELKNEVKILEDKLLRLKRQTISSTPQIETLRAYLNADHLTREMVRAFVKRITVYNDKAIHIDWLFDEKGVTNEEK